MSARQSSRPLREPSTLPDRTGGSPRPDGSVGLRFEIERDHSHLRSFELDRTRHLVDPLGFARQSGAVLEIPDEGHTPLEGAGLAQRRLDIRIPDESLIGNRRVGELLVVIARHEANRERSSPRE